jgi:hypothetical protein
VKNLNWKKRILSSLIVLALISTVILTLSNLKTKATPADETKLQILPATNTFYINTVPPGTIITLNITVVNVTDLFTWQVAVHWDPTMLNYSKIGLPLNHVFAGKQFYEIGPDIHYTEGTVYYSLALAQATIPTFNGTGTLCQLNLTILKPTTLPLSCDIEFLNPPPASPSDTFLLNHNGLDITFTSESSTYNYLLMEHVTHTVSYLGTDYTVETYSNASITPDCIELNGTAKMITFDAIGYYGNAAFVNVTIPKALLNASITGWKVYVNGTQLPAGQIQITENATDTFVYAEFSTSVNTVGIQGTWIVPELSSMFIFLIMAASSTVIVASKFKLRQK